MRKIKWGVMGTAYIFERDTARGMQLAESCERTAIAGRSLEKAEQFKEKYGFARAYGSYAELLEDPEIEAVYIALPNHLHYEWTIRALEHGKHVLCEKPLAPSKAEAEEMFRCAERNHVTLMEAFAYQHSPYVAAIQREIASGAIGEIQYIEAALITSDYLNTNIRMRRETLGGCTYDLGVYPLSFIQRMMGRAPVRIHATACFDDNGIDRYTTGVLEYEGGAKANFSCGMVLATEKNLALDRFRIYGSKGTILSQNFGFNAPGQLSYRRVLHDGSEETVTVDVPNNYFLEVDQMARIIAAGEEAHISPAFSIQLAGTVDGILDEIDY